MISAGSKHGNLSLALTVPDTDQQLRIVGTQEQPAWVAKDVCEVLGLSDVSMALSSLDNDEKGTSIVGTPGGPQEMLVVTEPGLYALVLKSRKPAAKTFKRWILHDVLPCIRHHGCYPAPTLPTNPTAIMLRELASAVERQDQLESRQVESDVRLQAVECQLLQMSPKTDYCTVVGYARQQGWPMTRKDASRHGKALSTLHRKRGVAVEKVPDERFGMVNTYLVEIMEEYFAGLE